LARRAAFAAGPRRRPATSGPALAIVAAAAAAGPLAGQEDIQLAVTPPSVSVEAGQTTPPITVLLTTASPAQQTRTYAVEVELPAALVGHATPLPGVLNISVPPGAARGQGVFRVATAATGPTTFHSITLKRGVTSAVVRLEIRAPAEPTIRLAVTPPSASVEAGQTTPPVTVVLTTDVAVQDARTYEVEVEIPAGDAGLTAQPAVIPITVPPGGLRGTGVFRVATAAAMPGLPKFSNITLKRGVVNAPFRLEVRAPTAPPGPRDPTTGTLQAAFVPASVEVCPAGDPATTTLEIRGIGGYRGTASVAFPTIPTLTIDPTYPDVAQGPVRPGQGVPVEIPPDRRIPVAISAAANATGAQVIVAPIADPSRQLTLQARAQVTIRASAPQPVARPATLTRRQGGPPAAAAIGLGS
jgi:hypothetical protein